MLVKTIIADDEPLARARLKRLLSKSDLVQVIAEAETGEQAIKLIQAHQPDLVLLDINMPLKTGIDVAKEIKQLLTRRPAVIFTTAYEQYALDAFELNASSYLVKPISESALMQAIENATSLNKAQVANFEGLSADFIHVKRSTEIESVQVSKISHFKAQDKLVVACCESGAESVVSYTLKELEEKLTPAFSRTHRNTLINISYMERLYKDESGQYFAQLRGNNENFSVSRRQVSALKKVFS